MISTLYIVITMSPDSSSFYARTTLARIVTPEAAASSNYCFKLIRFSGVERQLMSRSRVLKDSSKRLESSSYSLIV